MIAAISLQNQSRKKTASTGEAMDGEGEEESSVQTMKNTRGKAARLEFPKFDGDGFDGWLMRVDYFFEMAEVPEKERVRVTALHLEAKALQWHRGYISLKGKEAYDDWETYIGALANRFGVQAYKDPFADLRNLRQVSSLQQYMDEFDEKYSRTGIREDQALSFFLSGLINELQMPVRMFKPRTLADTYALAKLQELTVAAMHNKPKAMGNSGNYSGAYNSGAKSISVTITGYKSGVSSSSGVGGKESGKQNVGVQGFKQGPRLSSKEMDEKRAKGLCFWCEEKYTPNHRCPKKRLFTVQMLEKEMEEEDEVVGEEGEGIEEPTELQLSLHAMWGLEGNQIMRIKGECQKKPLRILIDTWSTHNFISEKVVKKVKCNLVQVLPAAVEVANGQQLQSNFICADFK